MCSTDEGSDFEFTKFGKCQRRGCTQWGPLSPGLVPCYCCKWFWNWRFEKILYFSSVFCKRYITCSWHQKNETLYSPIHEFKVLHKDQRAFWNPFLMMYYFFFITLKDISSLDFFILKALKDILQHFKFVNW